MSSESIHTNLAIVLDSFVLGPFVIRSNNRAVDASLDGDHAHWHRSNDYYTDRFVGHHAPVAIDAGSGQLVGVVCGLAVALT